MQAFRDTLEMLPERLAIRCLCVGVDSILTSGKNYCDRRELRYLITYHV